LTTTAHQLSRHALCHNLQMHAFYSRKVLPKLGGLIAGDREACEYLPQSVGNFPDPAEHSEQMQRAGFGEVRFELMTGGSVALHIGRVR